MTAEHSFGGAEMAWRPGPPFSQGLARPDYDERDTWTQRFLSKTEDGQLSLDVNVRPYGSGMYHFLLLSVRSACTICTVISLLRELLFVQRVLFFWANSQTLPGPQVRWLGFPIRMKS